MKSLIKSLLFLLALTISLGSFAEEIEDKYEKAVAALKKSDRAGARELLNEILKIDDTYAKAYYQRAQIELYYKEYDKVEKDLKKVIELNSAYVDEAKLDLFASEQRPYEAIPPTRVALIQHTKCAAYQAGCM